MAMLIREQRQLPTLRLRLRMRRDPHAEAEAMISRMASRSTPVMDGAEAQPIIARPVISSQILHGDRVVSPWSDTEFAAVGLACAKLYQGGDSAGMASLSLAGLERQLRAGAEPRLEGTPIAGQIAALMNVSGQQDLLWLHIAQDAAPLALLPWEAMARAITHRPFVRIPNFFKSPFRRSVRPAVAICASAPIGSDPYALSAFVHGVAAAVMHAAGEAGVRPSVHIFVDQNVREQVQAALARLPGSFGASVEIHEFRPSDPMASYDRAGWNLWADWIAGALGKTSAEIVHFIGPSLLSQEGGVIALADGPGKNESAGTFVSAADLTRFYDRVGCTAMLFSNPAMPRWVAGQRALAFELSWTRAGPVVLTESGDGRLAGLKAAYGLLFGAADACRSLLAKSGDAIHLCCHPALFDDPVLFDGMEMQINPPGTDEFGAAAAYLRNQKAVLAPTRTQSSTERAQSIGSDAALDFLASLIGRS